MMRLSSLSLSYQNQFKAGKMDLPGFIRTVRGLNLDGVDLHMQHLKSFDRIYLKQLRRHCLDNGLSIPSFPVSTEFGMYPERINHPNFSLVLDTGHFTGRDGPRGPKQEGHSYEHYYRSLEQVAPIAPFVRVKLYEVDEQDREKFIDYKRVFDILRGVHYNGHCSLVYEGTEDEMAAIPRGARSLRQMMMSA